MKIKKLKGINSSHIIAIDNSGESRCYAESHSSHFIDAVINTMERDIRRHGEKLDFDFKELKVLHKKISRKGNTYFTTQELKI